jgi:hypothetical protein
VDSSFKFTGERADQLKATKMSARDSFGEEFHEIGNCGGKFELIRNEQGISMRVSTTGAASYFQMGISLDGDRMEYWPIRGVDQRPAKEPSPMVPAFLPAAKQDFGDDSVRSVKRTSGRMESKNTCFVPTAIVAHRLPHSPLKISALFLIGNANSGT